MDRGVRLFSAAQALRDAIGISCPDKERAAFEEKLAAVPCEEGAAWIPMADRFAWTEGRAMTMQDAVEEALLPAGER